MDVMVFIIVWLVLAVGLPIRLIINIKYDEENKFQCPKCFHTFNNEDNELSSYIFLTKLHVKCPKCGRYSTAKFLKPKGKCK